MDTLEIKKETLRELKQKLKAPSKWDNVDSIREQIAELEYEVPVFTKAQRLAKKLRPAQAKVVISLIEHQVALSKIQDGFRRQLTFTYMSKRQGVNQSTLALFNELGTVININFPNSPQGRVVEVLI